MILNSKNSSFYFVFPRGFFPKSITDKYETYIKKQPTPYDTIQNYMNSTIQSINIPGLTADSVEQTRNLGKKISYRSATPIQDLFNSDFNVTFKMADGFINYWIMLDTVLYYLDFKNKNMYIQNLPIRIMDNEGNILVSVTFKENLITSISNIDLNMSNNNPQFSTFELGFKFNYLDIQLEIKK